MSYLKLLHYLGGYYINNVAKAIFHTVNSHDILTATCYSRVGVKPCLIIELVLEIARLSRATFQAKVNWFCIYWHIHDNVFFLHHRVLKYKESVLTTR